MFSGGGFEIVQDQESPFGYKRGEGVDAGHGDPEWIVNKERYKYDALFDTLSPVDGKVTGAGMSLGILIKLNTLNYTTFQTVGLRISDQSGTL